MKRYKLFGSLALAVLLVSFSFPVGVFAEEGELSLLSDEFHEKISEKTYSAANDEMFDDMMPSFSLMPPASVEKPYITDISLSKTQVKITFSQYMKPSTVSSITLKNSSGSTVGYTLDYSQEMTDGDGNIIADDFTFVLKSESEIFAISVPSSVKNSEGTGVTTGMNVKGVIMSYNPQNKTTVSLIKNDVEYATCTIEACDGFDVKTQRFVFGGVPAGKYDLVVTKAGYIPYKISDVVVRDKDVDLSQYDRDYQTMQMIAGDINGDGNVNATDWSILWSDENYLKSTENVPNKLCDINGDGNVNATDWSILWSDVNYLKGANSSTFAYVPPTSYETEIAPFIN